MPEPRLVSLKAVLDSQLFIHFQPIDNIDWIQLLNAASVELIVTSVLIRQLNNLKDGNRPQRIRERAAAALKKLHFWSEQQAPINIRERVSLSFRVSEPDIDFASRKLRQDVEDDWFIAATLHLREENKCDVVLVTNDVGLKLKAREHSIPTFSLPDNLETNIDKSPERDRLQQLEEELRILKNKAPLLDLRFEDGSKLTRIKLEKRQISEEGKKEILDTLREQFPPLRKASGYSAGRPSPQAIDNYNKQLETFYANFGHYLEGLNICTDKQSRLLILTTKLFNEGSSPAEDVDVKMSFPDGGFQVTVHNPVVCPEKPKAPKEPPSSIEQMYAYASTQTLSLDRLGISTNFPDLPPGLFQRKNVSELRIDTRPPYLASCNVRYAKHLCPERLRNIFVLFDSWQSVRSFHIDYELLAANIPVALKGVLHVVIEVA